MSERVGTPDIDSVVAISIRGWLFASAAVAGLTFLGTLPGVIGEIATGLDVIAALVFLPFAALMFVFFIGLISSVWALPCGLATGWLLARLRLDRRFAIVIGLAAGGAMAPVVEVVWHPVEWTPLIWLVAPFYGTVFGFMYARMTDG